MLRQRHREPDKVLQSWFTDGSHDNARFIEQIILRAHDNKADFSLPGDSGSLVVASGGEDDEGNAVGVQSVPQRSECQSREARLHLGVQPVLEQRRHDEHAQGRDHRDRRG